MTNLVIDSTNKRQLSALLRELTDAELVCADAFVAFEKARRVEVAEMDLRSRRRSVEQAEEKLAEQRRLLETP